ncbi:capsid protein [Marmot associated genomovirus 4]|nr:capsid protein [Marmot associated genomovirus 4]QIJ55590.1 capsid protein [Marmot associated genomovirus 4]
MAYRSTKRSSYARRRYPARKYGGTKKRRASTKKRPTYRRKSRTMSKKSILNMTSRKKRNGMTCVSNTNTTGTAQAIAPNALYISAGQDAICLFSPTAMDLVDYSGAVDSVVNQAQRTASTCFMRGFKENIRIQTSTGLPWFWRRICFTYKGNDFRSKYTDTPTYNTAGTPWIDTSNGMERLWLNSNINTQPTTISNWVTRLFKGTVNVDWSDFITAPIDTSRISLKFDKTKTIKSGNSVGTVAEYKMWHPMNQNLVFDDDESGEAESSQYFSVDSKAGMGDYYIIDFIQGGSAGSSSDVLRLQSSSTLYWHEK